MQRLRTDEPLHSHGETFRDVTESPRLLIVSNRLPITIRDAEAIPPSIERSAGGLATALAHAHAERQSLWFGWPGLSCDDEETRHRLTRLLHEEYRCSPVFLSTEDIKLYYDGFSNRALWPLCHLFQAHVVYEDEEWEAYGRVNRQFCDAIVAEAMASDVIWIQDYHLFLLPKMLREQLPQARIGFFLHTPFPPSELFRLLPCREELLRGLLGADVVSFQTFAYRQNFLWAVYRVLGIDADKGVLPYEGRQVQTAIHPISVDPSQFLNALEGDTETAQEIARIRESLGERKLVLGMDRLDYSKGIPQRLRAYQRFLATHPEWHERITMVQVAVPSREQVATYQELRQQVDKLVGEINGTYGTTAWTPLQYLYRNLPFAEICALLHCADIALVTPLRDGMNLVAKEYAVCQRGKPGALILSEFAGASSEMGEAFFVNPYDIEGMAARIAEILSLPEDLLLERMQTLHQRVCTHTVQRWAAGFLEALEQLPQHHATGLFEPHDRMHLRATYQQAKRRLLLLDYDGTLTPLIQWRDRAAPSPRLLAVLKALQDDPYNVIAVISGRSRALLEKWLGECGCILVAEHGAWIWETAEQSWCLTQPHLHNNWKETLFPILQQVAEHTPGSSVEEKEFSLVWHYRMADPEFGLWQAHELYSQLQGLLAGSGLHVHHGHKIVEVKWAEIHKGTAVMQLMTLYPEADFILAIGDDRTDEDMFAVVPAEQWTVKVGAGLSCARFALQTPAEVLELLHDLVSSSREMPANIQ